jgi:hypothetical protein
MDDLRAHRIISALANGANPLTGELFSAESPYQSPEIIRALYTAARMLEARLHSAAQSEHSATIVPSSMPPSTSAPNNASIQRPQQSQTPRIPASANAGKTWSAEEDRMLLAAFDAGKSLGEIARSHERTQGGVRARLEKHGRLEPSPATRWPAKSPNEDRPSGSRGGNETRNRTSDAGNAARES